MRFALVFVLAGCGTLEHLDAGPEIGAAEPDPTVDPGPTCTGQNFIDLCGSLDRLQIDAMRCTYGAPSQCTHTAAREFIAMHNFGRCPLFVTDVDSSAVKAYSAAMDDWRACRICACDFACDYRDTPFPCLAESECMPTGHCRQSNNPVDGGTDRDQ